MVCAKRCLFPVNGFSLCMQRAYKYTSKLTCRKKEDQLYASGKPFDMMPGSRHNAAVHSKHTTVRPIVRSNHHKCIDAMFGSLRGL